MIKGNIQEVKIRYHATDNIATGREETYHKKWVPYENDVYLFYFYNPITGVVDWGDDGLKIKKRIIKIWKENCFHAHKM